MYTLSQWAPVNSCLFTALKTKQINTVKRVSAITCIKQSNGLKHVAIQFMKRANELKFTSFKQANFGDLDYNF